MLFKFNWRLLPGIFLPEAVFFSKDNFIGKKNTMKMFSKFSKWNSVAFFGIGINYFYEINRHHFHNFSVHWKFYPSRPLQWKLPHLHLPHPPAIDKEWAVQDLREPLLCSVWKGEILLSSNWLLQMLLQDFPGYKSDAGFLWAWMFSWFLTCAHVGLSWAESYLI